MLSPDSEPKWHCHHARNRLFARTSFNGSRPILPFFLSDPLRIPFCENDGKFSVSRFILSTYVCIPFFFLLFLSFVYSLLLNSQSELLLLLSFLLAKLSLLENDDGC